MAAREKKTAVTFTMICPFMKGSAALFTLKKKGGASLRTWAQKIKVSFFRIMGKTCSPADGTNINILMCFIRLLTTGETIGEAVGYFIALEQACQAQLLVEAAAANGIPKKLVGDEEAKYTKQNAGQPEVLFMQFVPEYEMVLKETNGDFLA